jgi:hypothetical protein
LFKDSKRKSIFRVNKFQKMLFFPAIFAFIIGCCVAWLSMVYSLIGNYLSGPRLDSFQGIIPAMLAFATVLMIALVFWTLKVTTHYFGAYERIIEELDKTLDGQGRGPIKTRQGDVIFEGLLKRINRLIERMQ